MKRYFILFLSLCALNTFGQEPKPRFVKIKSIYFDLNNDGKADTITLSSSLKSEHLFNKISIVLSSGQKKTFIAKDSWTIVDKWFVDSNKNESDCNLIFIKKTKLQSVILLFGVQYGSGERDEFSIINIENNTSKMAFDDDGTLNIESPCKLIDLNNDGRLDFIYCNLHEFDEQTKAAMIGTYEPFFVYPVGDNCRLNKPLMKRYNEEHYVFAGYIGNSRLKIRYPKNGDKPTLLKRKRAEQ